MNTPYLSRRISSLKALWPQLIVAGVILFGLILWPHPVAAMGVDRFEIKEPEMSLLDKNKEQLDKLDDAVQTQEEKVKNKDQIVAQLHEESQKIETSVGQLQNHVADMKQQVEQLKAQLAEKKRLEAERTVPASHAAADSAGNTYALGNCTWYVKSLRPDLSNGLGNANTWFAEAQAMGYKTGTMAKKGAVGTTTRGWLGHVVYVEKWLGDGKVLITEMNYSGLYSTRERIADESEFVYIYELQ